MREDLAFIKKRKKGQINLPWLTNSEPLLELQAPVVLIDETLLCDCIALLSISLVPELQKPSDLLDLFTTFRPRIRSPFDG